MECVYPHTSTGILCHEYSNDETNSLLRIFEISGPTAVFNKKTGFESVICVPPGSASRLLSRDQNDPLIMTMDVLKRSPKKRTNS
jgi:hypothetical protein